MWLGIFAKTFSRPSLEETLDAVRAHGLGCVQFNMTCAGLPALATRTSTESNHSTARETSAPQAVGSVTSGQRALRSLPEFRGEVLEAVLAAGGEDDVATFLR